MLGIAASPIILFLLLTVLLYLPPVQRWAVGIATHCASEETGMDISIADVRLRFPLDLQLGGVCAIKPNDSIPQQKDTLLNAQRIICNVQLLPLLNSNVQIDIMQMDGVQLNTTNLISDCRVRGRVGQLMMKSHGIDLKNDTLLLNKACLADADLDICLTDTAKEDTTQTPNPDWKIRFQNLDILRTRLLVHMPGDTLNIGADITALSARDGMLNLQDQEYSLLHIDLNNSRVKYDNRYKTKEKGLDVNHIDVCELNVGIDSLYYRDKNVRVKLRACNAQEKCGLRIASLTGDVHLDSLRIIASDINLQTLDRARQQSTSLHGNVNMELNTFSSENPGVMLADVNGQIGRYDVMLLAGESLPEAMVRRWPQQPAALRCRMSGNMRRCQIADAMLDVPTMAKLTMTATLLNLDNQKTMQANAAFNAVANGNNGTVTGKVAFSMKRMEYDASLKVSRLNISHFVPGSGMGRFTGNISVKGHGTDVFSPSMAVVADASVGSFAYGKYNLSGSRMNATLRNGMAHAELKTVSDILNTDITLTGRVLRNSIDASVTANIQNIDFYALRLVKRPLALAFQGNVAVKSDLKQSHALSARISDIQIIDTTRTFTPNDVVAEMLTRPDTTHATIACGDFMLNADFSNGYKRLMTLATNLTNEVTRQVQDRIIDESAIRNLLPDGTATIRSGRDNPVARMAGVFGYGFANFDSDISVSRTHGINGYLDVDTLVTNGMQFDCVNLRFEGDEQQLGYRLHIANGPKNPNFTFSADAVGRLQQNGTTLSLAVDDMNGRRGMEMSLEAVMEQDYIRLSLTDSPVIAYVPFRINDGNYIRLSRDMRVLADVRLIAADGTNFQIYTNDDNDAVLQDITLSVNNLNLGEVTSALPFMPDIKGTTNSDFHLILDREHMSISIDSDLKALAFEDSPIGNLSVQMVYMPQDDGSHYIDGILLKDDEEVASIRGKYYFEGTDMIDAEVDMTQMPMDIINGFVPEQIVGMKGVGTGKLTVHGFISNPNVNGTIDLSEATLVSVPYGVELKMDQKTVEIVNSSAIFENYRLTAANSNPIVLDGYFDFSSLSNMLMNMHVRGENVMLINAKETRHSTAYGKGYVNFYAQLNGNLSSLNVKAKLDVLPSTNLYYVLKDSPISTDNRLNDLVSFIDFDDDEDTLIKKPVVKGMNMDLQIDVRDGSHIVCWLNMSHTNYLDIYGSGELRMRYAYETLKMNGRYTFSQGEMKYSLPIIPLKTFYITPDSYIEFTGDILDPKLSITATEETRTSANVDGTNMMVTFDCGVVLSKTLKDMGLEFIISAKDNSTIDDKLNVLSKEERAKMAVGMLTTGMFLDGANDNMLSNASLSTFLQQGILNIAGSALKTIDLTLGAENTTTPEGSMQMDYTFKFARRFWNNRISVVVGGKISTGTQTAGKTPSFFDNVELQYRLSDASNQYLRLFYKHDVYDYLEGYLDHFGAGYMWKRKLQRLSDIFGQKQHQAEDNTSGAALPPDSLINNQQVNAQDSI